MSSETLGTNNQNNIKIFQGQYSTIKEELFNIFHKSMLWKMSELDIITTFWTVLDTFDNKSLELAKNDLIEFIGVFLGNMEIDEVFIKNFQGKYKKYLLYKAINDIKNKIAWKL